MKWKSYLRDRVIAQHPDGFVIIKPNVMPMIVPLACPVCDQLLKTSDDEAHYMQFNCCDRCANRWAYANRDRWHDGWRPPEVDVRRDVLDRHSSVVQFVVD